MKKSLLYGFLAVVLAMGCSPKEGGTTEDRQDRQAKQLLQGIWVTDDGQEPAMFVRGDSIFYPDTSSLPVRFWIYGDSIYLQGSNVRHYRITKQAPHLFKLLNQNGDEVKLVKSEDRSLIPNFFQSRPYAMNLTRVERNDTSVVVDGIDYDCKLFVEPTSDRVVKSSYNGDGIEVDNMYLDNVAHLRVFVSGTQVLAHDFRKAEFSRYVPKDFLASSILRDVAFTHATTEAVFFDATIGIPDATTCYVVELKIDRAGKLTKRLK